tara:strand:+ start:562 stop:741 length:180 start_codon:yes stop_codon:yes gene_type:complete
LTFTSALTPSPTNEINGKNKRTDNSFILIFLLVMTLASRSMLSTSQQNLSLAIETGSGL